MTFVAADKIVKCETEEGLYPRNRSKPVGHVTVRVPPQIVPDYEDSNAIAIAVVGGEAPDEVTGRVVIVQRDQDSSQPSVTAELDDVTPGLHYWSLRGGFVGNRVSC